MNDETIDVMIEIPAGSRNKYEAYGPLRQPRHPPGSAVVYGHCAYPADYGFVPGTTLSKDGDPLDASRLGERIQVPSRAAWCAPAFLGVFFMRDEAGLECRSCADRPRT